MHWGRLIIKTIKWIIISIVSLCIIFVGGCWLIMELAFPPHKTDDIMLQNFVNNRAIFEGIVTKVEKDGDIIRVGDNWYKLTDGEARHDTPERIVQYRKMFKDISVDSGISVSYSSNGKARVVFYSNCIGFVTGGSCKGYAYEPYPRDAMILVDSIDDHKANKDLQRSYWSVHRKIEGAKGWYLYCDFDD